ncbi:MAG: tyrosine-protein phosphatase [Oscillospiraceae bacterium]|nr:tyrosine-protein phosphatase [Oscillospiraceae bacterium]
MTVPREDFFTEKTENGYAITAARPGIFHVYWATSPDGFCDDNDCGAFEDTARFDDPHPGKRLFFHIMQNGRYSVATPRSIPAGGMYNLRDVGGYNTADGEQFVRYGRVYRSDMLCLCGEENMKALEELHLKKIIDFRGAFDFSDNDSCDPPVRGAANERLPLYKEDEIYNFTLDEAVQTGKERLHECYQRIFDSYALCVFDSPALRTLFRYLADGRTPLLFHCYAGKDRTGIAAALFLQLLGVPRETIVYDYVLTRQTRREFSDKKIAEYGALLDKEMLHWVEFFTLVIPEAIESTLDAVAARYPDPDSYYIEDLHLTPQDLRRIRELYLTRH